MVVIVVIPIAIGAPAVAIFVPPAMAFVPAAFAGLAQFVARVIRLPAFPAVVLDGFVKPVVRLGNTSLATIVAFGGCPWGSRECQHAKKCCGYQQGPSEELLLSQLKRHSLSILPF
jgi:hypothetical protein